MLTAKHTVIVEKTYDVETGHGALECAKRSDGKFDLVVFCGHNDLTLYDLSPRELAEIGHKLVDLAATK